MRTNYRGGCLASISMLLLLCVAGLLLTSIPVNRGYAQTAGGVEIFVISNGVHTDLVVPVKTPDIDWRQRLPLYQFAGADSTYTYLSFGWGDRRFYVETPEWKDLTPDVAISAALWPTPSALHVAYLRGRLAPGKRQRRLQLSPAQYQQLVTYITHSFQQQNGRFILMPGVGYTDQDNFYEARGRFFLFNNCNNWVNRGLKAAGVRTALWAPLPFAVMRHLPRP
ncbi:TIGR02117 family protein [Pontibacter liquoris]|uniref:TIGR02117 family protein n=1 Tax=Pontibacter liquoris TaxID=2905677 RepID=UPI001FA6E04D|nr:TIGR02117 family protein [Pontibacter liquoris]